jgi:hypothetical protein
LKQNCCVGLMPLGVLIILTKATEGRNSVLYTLTLKIISNGEKIKMDIVKTVGTEFALAASSANNFSNNRLVRFVSSANTLITRAYSNGVAIGTFSIPSGQIVFAAKEPTDTFASNAAINAVSVAFQG